MVCYGINKFNFGSQGLKGYQGPPGQPGRKGLPVSYQGRRLQKLNLTYRLFQYNKRAVLSCLHLLQTVFNTFIDRIVLCTDTTLL